MLKIYMSIMVLLIGTVSCVNNQAISYAAVGEAKSSKAINAVSMGCGELPRHCDLWQGANQYISYNNTVMRFAANDNGNIVIIMHDTNECDILDDCATPINNRNFRNIKDYLHGKNIEVTQAAPIAALDSIEGYQLTLDSDAYSALMQLAISK